MRVITLNFKWYTKFLKTTKITALTLIILILVNIFCNAYFSSDAYTEALAMENEKNLVIIDAGHGGEDPGAIGKNGIYEKNLNLEIANLVGKTLSEKGFAVVYTRTEDKLLYSEEENVKGLRKISDLKNRCKIAAEYPNSIFISIHMNSYSDPKYSGLQVYYSQNNEESKILAAEIQASVKEQTQPENNRVIKAGTDIYVLENTQNTSVLIECGFLTNYSECVKLSEKEYQKQLSLSIVCGIINYREKIN